MEGGIMNDSKKHNSSSRKRRNEIKHKLVALFAYIDLKCKPTSDYLKQCSILDICSHIVRTSAFISIIVGVIFYVVGCPQRRMQAENQRKAKHYQAWQVINVAQGKTGSGGRIDALQDLNRDGVSLALIDISNATLTGINLKNAILRGANLSNADLPFSNLSGADLQKTNLSETDLSGANLSRANLSGSNLRNSNLNGSNLTGANLDRTDLSGANLSNLLEEDIKRFPIVEHRKDISVNGEPPVITGVRILDYLDYKVPFYKEDSKQEFKGANLSSANLSYANLSGAFLGGANLQRTQLKKAILNSTNLNGVNLSFANLYGADLRNAFMHKAYMPNAIFDSAILIGADFMESYLPNSSFIDANLCDTLFIAANLSSANFSGANLYGIDFGKAYLSNAILKNIKNWQSIKNIANANIYNVIDPPEGFIKWAKEHGAVSIKFDEK